MGKLQGLEDKSRHQNCTELTLTNGNLNLISACNFIRVFAHCTWTWPLPGIGDGSGIEDWTSVFLQGDHFEMHKSSFHQTFPSLLALLGVSIEMMLMGSGSIEGFWSPHPLISARIAIGRELALGLGTCILKREPLCRLHGELQYVRLG